MIPFPLSDSKNNNKRFNFRQILALFSLYLAATCSLALAQTTKTHGIALYGEPKYSHTFTHFQHTDPLAPKGGHITLSGHGTFDNLNPYILKGTSPINTPGFYVYGIHELNETLLAGTGRYSPSHDEPSTAYGLIAKTLEYPDDFSYVVFHLNPNAYFHDRSSITAEDVEFSYKLLTQDGHPRYQSIYENVAAVSIINKETIRFDFKVANNKSLILRVGELPVLSKRFWQGRSFDKALTEPPLLSGPYKVSQVDFGRSITYSKVDDFWGKDHSLYRGRYNFDAVTFDFYRDITVSLEAFKSNDFEAHMEYVSKQWLSNYDIPAAKDGRLHKVEIPHQIAQGSQSFFFNTRKPLFQDRRVREALALLFDFEWTNKTIFSNAYSRSNTFFPNTSHAASGLPSDNELALLEDYKSELDSRVYNQTFKLPTTKANGNIRTNLRKALQLLKDAGWELNNNQLINKTTETHFEFELLKRFDPSFDRILLPYKKNLQKAGITMNIRSIDPTLYKTRLDEFNFDMIVYVLPQSNSPSLEQKEYYHSSMADIKGSRNYAGIKNPVVDGLVGHLIKAKTSNEHRTAVKALDRVLLWEFYTIPHWYIGYHRFAYWNRLVHPTEHPPYSLGFTNWWVNTEKATTQNKQHTN